MARIVSSSKKQRRGEAGIGSVSRFSSPRREGVWLLGETPPRVAPSRFRTTLRKGIPYIPFRQSRKYDPGYLVTVWLAVVNYQATPER